MLKKLASRKDPVTTTRKVTYTIRVHALDPWPLTLANGSARSQSLAIGWARGHGKRGTTRVVRGAPSDADGARGAKYTFEHEFTVECTMTVHRDGGVKTKGLELAVLAVPEDATPGERVESVPVGAVNVDLGVYLNAYDGVSDGYDVDTSESVIRAVGRAPKLYVSVAARASGEAPATLRELSSASVVRNVSLSPQRRDEPTEVARDMQGTGYQWASSRFRPDEESNAAAQSTTPAPDQAAALASMASMFKKREQPAMTNEESVSETREDLMNTTPVEEDSAERSALFGIAPPPRATFAARDEEEREVESKDVARDDIPEDDAEIAAARAELFGAATVKTATNAPDVDSDGFLLDSDLESEDERAEDEPEFATPTAVNDETQELARAEVARKAAEDAAREEEEARRIAEEDALVAKLEAARKEAEDEARLLAEQEALEVQRAEEERRRVEEESRLAHFELERQRAEEEARRLAEQDAFEEERRQRAEEDAARAEEERRWAAEAEVERARVAAEESKRAAREHEEAMRVQRELQLAEEKEEEARMARLEEERVLAVRQHEQRLAEERAIQAAEQAAAVAAAAAAAAAAASAAASHEKEMTEAAEISADASSVLFADDDSTMLRTPSHSNADNDAFYTPAARAGRFAESAVKSSFSRDLEDELVSMSICDALIHGAPESTSFTPALSLQDRVTAVRNARGPNGAQNELNRIIDAFQVAINGAQGVNAARLTFICAQLVALRVCLAPMDDIDVHAVIELEIVARNAAFDTVWSQTFQSFFVPKSATFGLLNVTLNGDGERVGRAWASMFQFAKARLGVDAVDDTVDVAGSSSKLLIKQLQDGILIDLLLALDERVLDVLIGETPDAAVAAKIPGCGTLTFSAGAELKRAISPLAKAAIDCGLGKSVDDLIPRLRATADICMIPKDALVDAKLRDDIVCGALDARELHGIITKFTPDDFAPQRVDQSVIDAVIASAKASTNAPLRPRRSSVDYVPATSQGAPWISALARALASSDGAALKPSNLPPSCAHARRWTIVADALNT